MQSAMEKIKTSVKKLASKGLLNESEECILNKISMMKDIQKGADIDLLIEAIIENLEAKKGLFRNLSGLFPEKTIFCNEYLSIEYYRYRRRVRQARPFCRTAFFSIRLCK